MRGSPRTRATPARSAALLGAARRSGLLVGLDVPAGALLLLRLSAAAPHLVRTSTITFGHDEAPLRAPANAGARSLDTRRASVENGARTFHGALEMAIFQIASAVAARGPVERDLATAHLEAVATVHRLDVEDLAACETEDALHRRRHVLMHAIRELDDDDGPLAWGTHQATHHRARTSSELPQNDLHARRLARSGPRARSPSARHFIVPRGARTAESSQLETLATLALSTVENSRRRRLDHRSLSPCGLRRRRQRWLRSP